ncbi:hypothetical protein D1631_00430 [Chryseobacterium nematophagum]|uniref:Uncharacterized protein n=1 Tax=Chryseobacterium nematophagum TaxID=2305228 RepID=A0A3M7TLF1_9FLAO|nr:hypothetical protein [Chryseobacterium nematophagum]RNA64004.1 hypothetical protein D1631_00430 [Chryseobacterium nematophagum]
MPPQQSKKIENFGTDIPTENREIKELILESGYRNLPINISTIMMSRFDKMERSCHLECQVGMPPEFTDERLINILRKKHIGLIGYFPCNQNWLLISEGMDFYSYFSDIHITDHIVTNFDKVFIYRRFSSEVIVVK